VRRELHRCAWFPDAANPIYFIGNQDVIKQFKLNNGLLTTTPIQKGTYVYGYPGANMTISANGASNGILWTIEASGTNVLHAYHAANVSNEHPSIHHGGNCKNGQVPTSIS
jgi:hypothetical protein